MHSAILITHAQPVLYPTKSLGTLLRQAKALTSLPRVELTPGRWNSYVIQITSCAEYRAKAKADLSGT